MFRLLYQIKRGWESNMENQWNHPPTQEQVLLYCCLIFFLLMAAQRWRVCVCCVTIEECLAQPFFVFYQHRPSQDPTSQEMGIANMMSAGLTTPTGKRYLVEDDSTDKSGATDSITSMEDTVTSKADYNPNEIFGSPSKGVGQVIILPVVGFLDCNNRSHESCYCLSFCISNELFQLHLFLSTQDMDHLDMTAGDDPYGLDELILPPLSTGDIMSWHIPGVADVNRTQQPKDVTEQARHLKEKLAKEKQNHRETKRNAKYLEQQAKEHEQEVENTRREGASLLAETVVKQSTQTNKRKVTLTICVLLTAVHDSYTINPLTPTPFLVIPSILHRSLRQQQQRTTKRYDHLYEPAPNHNAHHVKWMHITEPQLF